MSNFAVSAVSDDLELLGAIAARGPYVNYMLMLKLRKRSRPYFSSINSFYGHAYPNNTAEWMNLEY